MPSIYIYSLVASRRCLNSSQNIYINVFLSYVFCSLFLNHIPFDSVLCFVSFVFIAAFESIIRILCEKGFLIFSTAFSSSYLHTNMLLWPWPFLFIFSCILLCISRSYKLSPLVGAISILINLHFCLVTVIGDVDAGLFSS